MMNITVEKKATLPTTSPNAPARPAAHAITKMSGIASAAWAPTSVPSASSSASATVAPSRARARSRSAPPGSAIATLSAPSVAIRP
jgi:hypothetical protein